MLSNAAVVRVVWVPAVLVGCSEWPRYSNVESPALVPATGVVTLVDVAAEDATTEFPPDPRTLVADTPRQVGGAYEGLRWQGALGWAGALAGGQADFGCGPQLDTTYQSDIDFFTFAHQGGALCMTVVPHAVGDPGDSCGGAKEPLWEMPLYKYVDGCPSGGWLNDATLDQVTEKELPEAYGLDRRALFFPRLDAGEYVVFLAGVCGTYQDLGANECPDFANTPNALPCVDYDFVVAVVPTQEACNQVHDDLLEARR